MASALPHTSRISRTGPPAPSTSGKRSARPKGPCCPTWKNWIANFRCATNERRPPIAPTTIGSSWSRRTLPKPPPSSHPMRKRENNAALTVQAIAGTRVVFLGMDLQRRATKHLLGFAIQRTDLSTGREYWLPNFRVFQRTQEEAQERFDLDAAAASRAPADA